MFGGENDTQYVGFFKKNRFRDHLYRMVKGVNTQNILPTVKKVEKIFLN